MPEKHVRRAAFHQLFRRERMDGEDLEIAEHLCRSCPKCRQLAEEVAVEYGIHFVAGRFVRGEEPEEDPYREAFQRVLQRAAATENRVAQNRLSGAMQWAELAKLSAAQRQLRLQNDRRFHHWGLLRELLEQAGAMGRNDPEEAVEVAQLAVFLAERLEGDDLSEERRADLLGAAWGVLGNARRIATDFTGAAAALHQAAKILAEGTGDLMEEAQLLSLQASLKFDLGRFEEAAAELIPAMRIYELLEDQHLVGRALLNRASALRLLDLPAAIGLLRQALALIDPQRDPMLALSAQHNLALFLNESGKPLDALALLQKNRPLYAQFPVKQIQLRLRWLEAQVSRSLGDLEGATHGFEDVREAFFHANLRQEFSLVSIELAEVQFARQSYDAAIEAVAGLHEVLAGWNLHAECLGVLLLLRRSLEEKSIQAGAFQELTHYLRRAWHQPVRL
jgi:tetratricopeptide (TPR) repeat protein